MNEQMNREQKARTGQGLGPWVPQWQKDHPVLAKATEGSLEIVAALLELAAFVLPIVMVIGGGIVLFKALANQAGSP